MFQCVRLDLAYLISALFNLLCVYRAAIQVIFCTEQEINPIINHPYNICLNSMARSGGTNQVRRCCLLLLLFSFQSVGESITTCLDFEPFEITPEGKTKWNGSNIETLHHVAQAASLELDTRIRAPFARCLELLKSGQIDILPGLIHTEERAASVLLVPYTLRHELAFFYPLNALINLPRYPDRQ